MKPMKHREMQCYVMWLALVLTLSAAGFGFGYWIQRCSVRAEVWTTVTRTIEVPATPPDAAVLP